MAHIEIYTAWQMAKKLFPRRKILAAYYQSRRTDDGLVIEVPHDRKRGETAEEYYSDAALLRMMIYKNLGAFKIRPSQTIVEDENGHKTSEWTRAVFFAPADGAKDRKVGLRGRLDRRMEGKHRVKGG